MNQKLSMLRIMLLHVEHLRGLWNKALLYSSTLIRYNYFPTDQFSYFTAAILQHFSATILLVSIQTSADLSKSRITSENIWEDSRRKRGLIIL